MRIAFVTSDWSVDGQLGGAGEARIGLPARALAAAGHEVRIGEVLAAHSEGWLTCVSRDGGPWTERPDVIVIQRWMHRDAAQLQREAMDAGQVVVHDIDDWFWGLDQSNRAFWSTHPSRSSEQNREHYRAALGACDLITVSTPYLAGRIESLIPGSRTFVVRNSIDVARFDAVRAVNEARSGDELTYAWVGALDWRSGDLETLRGVLGPALRDVGGKFIHCGASPSDSKSSWSILGLEEDQILGWREMVASPEYPVILSGIDVGLVPLSDVPFNMAKSCIKGMEYAAAGIAFAAQATPEYEWLGAGSVCRRPRNWARALRELADPDVRSQSRDAALDRVRELDISLTWERWEDAYSSLLPVGGTL